MLSEEVVMGALVRIENRLSDLERIVRVRSLPQRLFTLTDAAKVLGCGETKLNEQVRAGKIRRTRWGGRWMISMDEIIRVTSVTETPKAPLGPLPSKRSQAASEENTGATGAARGRAALRGKS